MTRKEAQARGLKRFKLRVPCPRGHKAERYTSNGECVECSRIANIAWCQNNPDKAHAIDKRSREKNESQRLATMKAWRLANAGHVRKSLKAWREENAKYCAAVTKAWRENNPERVRRNRMTRRARKRGAPGRYSVLDIQALFQKQRGRCLCGVLFSIKPHTIDHKTPLSRGGSNWPRNLQLLCSPCNGQKGTKTQAEWRAAS